MSDLFYQRDFSDDLWRWVKIYEPLKNHQVISNDPILAQLQQQIIQDQDAAMAFFCAEYFKYNIHLMQKVILNAQSPKYAFIFAKTFPKSDIKALQDIIIQSHNIKYLCYFGLEVKGSDRSKIEKLLIRANKGSNHKYAKYIYLWLKSGLMVNYGAAKDILMGSGKIQFLYELAKHLKSRKDIAKIEQAIIDSGSLLYMRLFAANIQGAHIKKIEAVVLASGNMKEVKRFIKEVKGSTLKNFQILF